MYRRLTGPAAPPRPDRALTESLRRMSPAERLAAYRAGAFCPHERALWASLYPDEPPLVNDEYEWIAARLADFD